MDLYRYLIRPVLFLFEPEKAHHITFSLLRFFYPFIKIFYRQPTIHVTSIPLFGLNFPHPVGLAAGLDKDGGAYRQLARLGFSFVELGTVTPKAQFGNPTRLFRIPQDQALINRMGFNNLGVDELADKLRSRPSNLIIGGNIGKNTNTPNHLAKEDYLYCFKRLYGFVDYFVVNVSCPNIADLKDLQDKDNLLEILEGIMNYRESKTVKTPVLLKVSPDLNEHQLDDLIDVVKLTHIDGLIATNTSVSRDMLTIDPQVIEKIGKGGLSGSPIHNRSLEVIRYLRSKLPTQFPIIASGGIMTEKDAQDSLDAGAQLIQLYSGFIYNGPGLIRKILSNWK